MTARRPGAFLGVLAAAWTALAGCIDSGGPPAGLRRTPDEPGPTVVFDFDATPLPDVPLPNDLATWADPDSPTGLRVNVSLLAPTWLEAELREKAQAVSGFGVYAPIWVRFDAPIDPARVRALHDDDAWENDAVYVVNVDPGSPRFGEFAPLDMGRGHLPLVLERTDRYFVGDPRAGSSNILLETADEDLNRNGLLDPGEDTDGDGVLDRPNVWPPGADPDDGLLTHYEAETNTLIIRVLEPLDQRAVHAVVLTRRLTGLDGRPVRSPFPFVNHVRQTRALSPLQEVLAAHGQDLDDVAFAWTFTTQDVTGDLEALRAGLYGAGPFARLDAAYPEAFTSLSELVAPADRQRVGNPYTLMFDDVQDLLGAAAAELAGLDASSASALADGFSFISHMVAGTFTGPYLLGDADGHARDGWRGDEDESWRLNPKTGDLTEQPGRVTFLCVIPKALEGRAQPFPTVLIAHGYGSNRLEMLMFSGSLARFGVAGCSIDAPGHGVPILEGLERAFVEELFGPGLLEAVGDGRARDLDNDGGVDSGGDYWTADIFHTRDMVRQAVLDYVRLVQILRSFDAGRDDLGPLTGDFDGDGTPDLGGRDNRYFMTGGSLGGILTGVAAGVEPALAAAAPIVGGGGLIDLAARSLQSGVPEAGVLRMMGPLAVLEPPDAAGARTLSFVFPVVAHEERLPVADIAPGDWSPGDLLEVEVDHARTGRSDVRSAPIPAGGAAMRVHFPADALTLSEHNALLGIEIVDPETARGRAPVAVPDGVLLGDPVVIRIRDGRTGRARRTVATFERDTDLLAHRWPAGAPLVAPAAGFGHRRGSADIRRFSAMAALLLEPGDPIAYAPHHFLRPLPADYDPTATPGQSVLHVPTIGDLSVPVATGIAMARAGGALDALEHKVLVDTYVVEGVERLGRHFDGAGAPVLLDASNLSEGTDGFNVPRAEIRPTVDDPLGGRSGLRLPYVSPTGTHGFGPPAPAKAFDIDSYAINLIGRFFQTDGRVILDDLCLEDYSCEFIPPRPTP